MVYVFIVATIMIYSVIMLHLLYHVHDPAVTGIVSRIKSHNKTTSLKRDDHLDGMYITR